MRGDDGAGAAVVARLREDDIPAYAFDGDGAELMEMWVGQEHVIIIDATLSEAPPGTVYKFEAAQGELPKNLFRHSTHQFGVAEAVEMARTLGRLPGRLTVYGVEGANFDLGAGFSPEVEDAVQVAVEHIKADIGLDQ